MIHDTVATNIRVLMAAHDLDARTVATVCRVSPATVSNWRKGRAVPQSGKIGTLATLLGVTVSDLYRRYDLVGGSQYVR